MTDSIKTITLQAETRFTRCLPSASCKDGNTINNPRTGKLELVLNSGQPESAIFYYPNIDICKNQKVLQTPGPDDRICDLIAVFDREDLDSLSAENPDVASLINDKVIEFTAAAEVHNSAGVKNSESSPEPVEPRNLLLNPPLLSGLAVLVLLIAFLTFRRRKAGTKKSLSSNKSRVNMKPVASFSNTDQSVVDEVRRQLAPVIERMNKLAVKLETIETDLISINQQKDMSTLAASALRFTQPPLPKQIQEPTKLRDIRPLDLNLIREAVLAADYTLISSYPHLFVTETLDSRQGKDDVVRFTIDGNQDNSDQRSQSEFIAIPYSGQTYIIPNLLPNASDPSRTIKRHVDRNKVYRGEGQNLLSLSELAIVERSGDSYVLKKPGRLT